MSKKYDFRGPRRIECAPISQQRGCGPDCCCKQEDAITTEIDPKDAE